MALEVLGLVVVLLVSGVDTDICAMFLSRIILVMVMFPTNKILLKLS